MKTLRDRSVMYLSSTLLAVFFAITLTSCASMPAKPQTATAAPAAPDSQPVIYDLSAAARKKGSKTKICMVGDWGFGSEAEFAVAESMFLFGCTDIVFLGDNFYPDGVHGVDDWQWRDKFELPYRRLIDSGARFFVALGNHDYRGNPDAQIEYGTKNPYWILPTRYYGFRLGSHCFFVVDTNELNATQMRWLEEGLLIPRTSGCQWRIVVGHHPVVSSGKHGNGKTPLQNILRPSLGGSDLYVAGHDHQFSDEGQYPVRESDPNGRKFHQIIAGTGGANLRKATCRTPQCVDLQLAYGFMHLYSNDNTLHWDFYDTNLKRLYSGVKSAGLTQ